MRSCHDTCRASVEKVRAGTIISFDDAWQIGAAKLYAGSIYPGLIPRAQAPALQTDDCVADGCGQSPGWRRRATPQITSISCAVRTARRWLVAVFRSMCLKRSCPFERRLLEALASLVCSMVLGVAVYSRHGVVAALRSLVCERPMPAGAQAHPADFYDFLCLSGALPLAVIGGIETHGCRSRLTMSGCRTLQASCGRCSFGPSVQQ